MFPSCAGCLGAYEKPSCVARGLFGTLLTAKVFQKKKKGKKNKTTKPNQIPRCSRGNGQKLAGAWCTGGVGASDTAVPNFFGEERRVPAWKDLEWCQFLGNHR